MFALFKILPVDIASRVGGLIARKIGRHTRLNKVAMRSLEIAFPDKLFEERAKIANAMWDNIGRVFAEFPHIGTRTLSSRVKISGLEHFEEAKKSKKSICLVSAHFGNWEIMSRLAKENGLPIGLVYRHVNNPIIEKVLRRAREPFCEALYPKGRIGAISLVKALKAGKSVGIMADQKMNNGIAVPFFGKDAMTMTTVAEFAMKMDCVILPVNCMRTGGFNFELRIYPEIKVDKTSDNAVFNTMLAINQILEEWIKESPEQWFWIHKRWDKKEYSC